MVPKERLESLHILKDIPRAALEGLARDMVVKKFLPGEVVIEEGSLSGSLFLIGQGTVSVRKKLDRAGERAKVVARLGAEEFFGEMSFLENKPHSASIVAEDSVEIFVLPRETLNDLINDDPKLAVEQILTLLSGVSSRLRSTTRELVTVFEVSRLMASQAPVEDLFPKIVGQIHGDLEPGVNVAFYRWNQFNEEFNLITAEGPLKNIFELNNVLDAPSLKNPRKLFEDFPDIGQSSGIVIPLPFRTGHLVLSHSGMAGTKDGLFIYYCETPSSFSPGHRQMMETISAVLAPALATARAREEEISRLRLERNRQGFSF